MNLIHCKDAKGAKKEFLVCPAIGTTDKKNIPQGFDFWPKATGPSGESASPLRARGL
jgi:hypothetical protein